MKSKTNPTSDPPEQYRPFEDRMKTLASVFKPLRDVYSGGYSPFMKWVSIIPETQYLAYITCILGKPLKALKITHRVATLAQDTTFQEIRLDEITRQLKKVLREEYNIMLSHIPENELRIYHKSTNPISSVGTSYNNMTRFKDDDYTYITAPAKTLYLHRYQPYVRNIIEP